MPSPAARQFKFRRCLFLARRVAVILNSSAGPLRRSDFKGLLRCVGWYWGSFPFGQDAVPNLASGLLTVTLNLLQGR